MTTKAEWRVDAVRVLTEARRVWNNSPHETRLLCEALLDALISAGYVTPPQSDATRDIMQKLSDLAIATEHLAIVEPAGGNHSVLSIIREAQAEIMRLRQGAPQPDAAPEGHVRVRIPVQQNERGDFFTDALYLDRPEPEIEFVFDYVKAWVVADIPLPSEPPTVKGRVEK